MIDPSDGVRSMTWNDADQLALTTDALGRVRRYDYGHADQLSQVVDATTAIDARLHDSPVHVGHAALGATHTGVAPNGATTRTTVDDFGRTIATDSADSGLSTRNFDAADRLIASTDAAGNHACYEYGKRRISTVLTAAYFLPSHSRPSEPACSPAASGHGPDQTIVALR